MIILYVFSRSDKKHVALLDFSQSSLAPLPLQSQKGRAWEKAVFLFPIAFCRVSELKHQIKNKEMHFIKHEITAICTL